MTNHNTTDGEQHYFANDGTDWRSTASAVSTKEAREQDAAQDGTAEEGPAASNEVTLSQSVVEGSESSNPLEDEDEGETVAASTEEPDSAPAEPTEQEAPAEQDFQGKESSKQ